MLDSNTSAQLKTLLERIDHPIEIVATLNTSNKSKKVKELIEAVAILSDKVTLRLDGTHPRVPSFGIAKAGEPARIFFAGLPIGQEFTSLILALLHTSGYAPRIAPEILSTIQELNLHNHFEVFISLTCHHCPEVVQALNLLVTYNPGATATMVDGAFFHQEIEERQIMAVPTVFQDNQFFSQGRLNLEEIVAKLDQHSASKEAAKLNAKDTFDILVIGGGPAGNSAAIYAARKGIKTGLVTDRMGGQVLDTMYIENFTSIQKIQGPQFSAQMEAHVRQYGVDIMRLQSVTQIKGADANEHGLIEVGLKSGATFTAKSVILATGARWREMNVPGEAEYRTRGVAYCPHCDAPLFKGKKVAVVGGGNSGVEAAIDLAGLVSHVTLIEFDRHLKADQVLQDKLNSLTNTTVLTQAVPIEVLGNGKQVTALTYKNLTDQTEHSIELAGIFVQIGLLAHTDFLQQSAVKLNQRGEIIINERNETNVKGIFAAGDCTTVPYKQVIIATGEGAKASLSAFDYLIRLSE